MEIGNFGWLQVWGYYVMVFGIVWDFVVDVLEFFQVEVLGVFGGFYVEWGVVVGVIVVWYVVLVFGFFWQSEEGFEDVVGCIDVGLWDVVVVDVCEILFVVGCVQFCNEGVVVIVEMGDVEGWNLVYSVIWFVFGWMKGCICGLVEYCDRLGLCCY